MAESQVKSSEWLKQGVTLYKENFFLLFTATFLAGLVPAIVMILAAATLPSAFGQVIVQVIGYAIAGPLVVGVFQLVFELYKRPADAIEQPPQTLDILKGMDKFKPAALFMAFWSLVQIIGCKAFGILPFFLSFPLYFIFVIAITTITLFGLPLIAKTDLEFWPASQKSIDTVKPEIVQFAIFSLLLGALAFCGVIFFIIGIFVSLPLYFCCVAAAYKDVFSEG